MVKNCSFSVMNCSTNLSHANISFEKNVSTSDTVMYFDIRKLGLFLCCFSRKVFHRENDDDGI